MNKATEQIVIDNECTSPTIETAMSSTINFHSPTAFFPLEVKLISSTGAIDPEIAGSAVSQTKALASSSKVTVLILFVSSQAFLNKTTRAPPILAGVSNRIVKS